MQSTQSSLDSMLFSSEKMKELQEVEDLIERLRSQLLDAEHRRAIIQGELASSSLTRKGIQNLPLELLCAIFVLIDDTQRERNYQLALVCKSWRTVVNGTPQLWTHIVVKWNGGVRSLIHSWRYMDLCIGRSNSLLLDVTIDLELMPTFDSYIWDLIKSHFNQVEYILPYSRGDHVETSLAMLLDQRRHRYDILVAKTIRKMCDTENPRCRSLELSIPRHFDGVDDILSNISAGAASLTKLKYRKMIHPNDLWSTVTHLPPFRSLKHLETEQNVDLHPTFLSTLEYLRLGGSNASSRFLSNASSCFPSLRFLSIHLLGRIELHGILFFPSLHTLMLHGIGQEAVISVLDAPSLDTLHLDRTFQPQYTTKSIPSLKNLWLSVNAWTDDEIPSFMAQFQNTLPLFPNLVFCSLLSPTAMCHAVSEVVARAIKDTREDGTALVLLKTINIIYAWTEPRKVYREVDVLLRNDGTEPVS